MNRWDAYRVRSMASPSATASCMAASSWAATSAAVARPRPEHRVVSIDALTRWTDIAEIIAKGDGGYLLAVKGNQSDLYANLQRDFACPDRTGAAWPTTGARSWSRGTGGSITTALPTCRWKPGLSAGRPDARPTARHMAALRRTALNFLSTLKPYFRLRMSIRRLCKGSPQPRPTGAVHGPVTTLSTLCLNTSPNRLGTSAQTSKCVQTIDHTRSKHLAALPTTALSKSPTFQQSLVRSQNCNICPAEIAIMSHQVQPVPFANLCNNLIVEVIGPTAISIKKTINIY